MSKINLTPNASGTGVFTIASPNSNTDRTLTLPDKAGTVNVGEGIDDNATSTAMTLDSSGNLLVGTTSSNSGERLSVVTGGGGINTAYFRFNTSDDRSVITVRHDGASSGNSRSQIRFENNAGSLVGTINSTGSATSYVTSSDYRLKENVVDLDNATDRLKQIPVHRFNFIADPDTVVDGFIAHEVQDVVPEAITGTKDAVDAEGNPEYQGIDQSKLVPLLTAALQEAITKIEDLESRLSAVEAN